MTTVNKMKSNTTLNNSKPPADIKKTKMREIKEDSESHITEARVDTSDDEDLGRSQEEINLEHVSAVSGSAK